MDERRAEWSAWSRVLFRFVFLYFVIYALPFPLGQIPGTRSVAGWWGDLQDAVSRWVGSHVLGLEVVIQPTGSGDTAQAFTILVVELVVAAAGALAWSLLARGRASHGRLLDALRTYVRFYLGATMLSYGAFKIIPTQFPYPSLVRLLEPLGNGSPMGLLWKFMGYSPAFSFFAGAGEFLGGFLIFFRRTTTLGALLLVVVLSNVVMMNYAYDVPVKLFSSHLLVMAGFLLLPDVRRLIAVLVLNRPTEARTLGALLPPGRARVAGWVVKSVLIGFFTWTTLSTSWAVHRQRRELPPLYGIWEAERFVRNADTLPALLGDSVRWRRMIVEGRLAALQTMTSPLQGEGSLRYGFEPDTVAGVFRLQSLVSPEDVRTFTFDRLEPDLLEARGLWEGDTLSIRLRRFDERSFLLTRRGFHWISELPFNR